MKAQVVVSESAIQSELDALATAMLEQLRNEGQDADPMLERAIRLDKRSFALWRAFAMASVMVAEISVRRFVLS